MKKNFKKSLIFIWWFKKKPYLWNRNKNKKNMKLTKTQLEKITQKLNEFRAELIPTVTKENRHNINESLQYKIFLIEKGLKDVCFLQDFILQTGYKPMFINL